MNRRELRFELRRRWREFKAAVGAWLIGTVYEMRPGHSYVLVLKKPARGELGALGEKLYANSKTRALNWFAWGPGLEVKELQDFFDERKRVAEDCAKRGEELDEWMKQRSSLHREEA